MFTWSLSSPLGWSWWSLGHAFVVEPILLIVIEWVDQVGYQLVLLCYLNHCSCVLVATTVVSGRENSEKLTSSKSFESVHDAFMGSKDEGALVVLQERLHSVWSKLDDIARTVGVSHEVWLDTEFIVAISWV